MFLNKNDIGLYVQTLYLGKVLFLTTNQIARLSHQLYVVIESLNLIDFLHGESYSEDKNI